MNPLRASFQDPSATGFSNRRFSTTFTPPPTHVDTLASAIAEGARAVDGAEVIVKREAAPLTRATKQPGGEAAIK